MVTCESAAQPGNGPGLIGQALVPYYRQILPVLNIFIRKNGAPLQVEPFCLFPEADAVCCL